MARSGRPYNFSSKKELTEKQAKLLEYLQEHPDDLEISQNKMAKLAGVSPKTMSQWMHDPRFEKYLSSIRRKNWLGNQSGKVYKSLLDNVENHDFKSIEKCLEILRDDAYVQLKERELDQKQQLIELEKEKIKLQREQLKAEKAEENSFDLLKSAFSNLLPPQPEKPEKGDDKDDGKP